MDAVRFNVDGEQLVGTRGDTVAAALLANGRLRVGDSLHLARPRGIVAAGADEPNALIDVRRGDGAVWESMLLATTVELVEGLQVTLLRGRGALDRRGDDARYDHRHVHTDVAVVGAGPAGLAAALAAARSAQQGFGGARVMLLDDQPAPGGALLDDRRATVDGLPAAEWIRRATAELDAMPHVRRLARTSVTGSYDDNHLVAVERRTDHLDNPHPAWTRQRVWHVRAHQVVLATGADERPLVFANNDRPGIMLAGAVRTYLNRYGLELDRAGLGRLPVIATTNDSAYALAHDLLDRGRSIALVVDARPDPGPAAAALAARGVPVRAGAVVVDTGAGDDGHLAAVTVAGLAADGSLAAESVDTVAADLLAVSGGWSPAIQLHSQRAGTVGWDQALAGFVPTRPVAHQHTAGAVTGALDLYSALVQGSAAGARAAAAAGFAAASLPPPAAPPEQVTPPRPVWLVPSPDGRFDHHFVDLQRDQTVADVMRARGAGLHAVEHVKRYTSIATAHDQGRTSSLALAGVMAVLEGLLSPGDTGLTTFRPPTVPVAFAALAGRRRGELFDPVRTTPIHAWHVGAGAAFEDVGQWKRPRYYPRPGEDMHAAVLRECAAVRERVGAMDASTLGKIELRGRDVGVFLDRIYTNRFSDLAIGRARYGVMCTADGMIFDDGVTIRIDQQRWLMTTTTGGAAAVLDWLEEWLQTEWPALDVVCTSVTEQFATIAIAGPGSRAVVAALAPDLDVSVAAFGFMDSRAATLASGIPARVSRISFSGELAYEVMVDGWYGLRVWNDVLEAGGGALTPYGTEAMHVLRAEKGYIICGQDTDGTVTPQDAGMSWIVSTTKDFIGRRSFSRPENVRPDRKHLVSLLPADPDLVVPEGAALVEVGGASGEPPVPLQGWVTSSYRSAALGRSFALALVVRGRERLGQTLHASFQGRVAEVVIAPTVVFDAEGRRRDG